MIDRYTLPEMASLWSEEHKFRVWLEIELLACEAWAELGKIPHEIPPHIRQRAVVDVKRIEEIEAEVHHDVIAFLTQLREQIGEEARYIHLGLTSSDVVDTALSVRMRDALNLIVESARALSMVLADQALRYRHTPMIGRTHGVHAEPITFGLKLALWQDEVERNIRRLLQAREMISAGKISGAVGVYANLDPRVEEYVCSRLGLRPATVSSQILQRDRHAHYLTSLAVFAGSLEKFATEIRGLQRTEVLEVEEPFRSGQKGSSAMPHKRNPVICERICGLARTVRGNALTSLENMALWHERDISHSSSERIIIPDSTTHLHYMLAKFRQVMEDLVVYPERMRANLERLDGLSFSERVLLSLVAKGMGREEAYALVQRHAMRAWRSGDSFRDLLAADAEIGRALKKEELDACFDLNEHLRHVDAIFERWHSGLDASPAREPARSSSP